MALHVGRVCVALCVLIMAPRVLAQSGEANAPAQFGSPLLFADTRCVMVPFGGDGHFAAGKLSQGPAFYLSDNLSGGFGAPASLNSALSLGACFDMGPIHWNNVIVAERESRQSRLLLNRKATIVRCLIPRAEPAHPPEFLAFTIADGDTNNDGVIDERGATVLYLADPLGRTLVPVTPPGGRVGTVTINASATSVYVQVLTDSEPGGSVLLHVDPAHPAIGTAVWTTDTAAQAVHLISP